MTALIDQILSTLSATRFARGAERQLESAVSLCLQQGGYAVRHQVATAFGRLDLKIENVAIELKVKGSLGAALTQASRYLQDPEIEAVIVATTCRWRMASPPPAGIAVLRLSSLF